MDSIRRLKPRVAFPTRLSVNSVLPVKAKAAVAHRRRVAVPAAGVLWQGDSAVNIGSS
jgi:hypothetical protein